MARLHAGDVEPLPKDTKVLEAWALSMPASSRRRMTRAQGRRCGHHRGQQGAVYLRQLLEKSEKTKLAMFQEV